MQLLKANLVCAHADVVSKLVGTFGMSLLCLLADK